MPIVAARGSRFHVQRLGAGSPVVMIHGLLVGSLASWYFTAAPGLARAHDVLLYDLRGHGKSDRPPSGYDLASMSADLLAVTDDFHPGQPIALVGHSYGALIALRTALDHPERVARLALVEAPLPPMGRAAGRAAAAPPGTLMQAASLAVGTPGLEALASRSPAELLEALPAAVRAFVTRGGRQARRLLESLRALTAETTLLADLRADPGFDDTQLASLRCPVLLVYGQQSPCFPDGVRLLDVIRGLHMEALPGGHYLHLDAPGPLTQLLLEACRG